MSGCTLIEGLLHQVERYEKRVWLSYRWKSASRRNVLELGLMVSRKVLVSRSLILEWIALNPARPV